MNYDDSVEGMTFRKARGCADKDCVEVGAVRGVVGVRDTKNNGIGPVLGFTPDAWAEFLGNTK